MYLSRVRYQNLAAARAAIDAFFSAPKSASKTNDYRNHQMLWQLFSEQAQRNFLFVEQSSQSQTALQGMPEYLVLSKTRPQQVAGLSVQTKSYQPQVHVGQKLGFKLKANPTITTTVKDAEGNWKKSRHDVLMHAKKRFQTGSAEAQAKQTLNEFCEQAALDWLANPKRMTNGGYHIEHAHVVASQQHAVRQPKNQRTIRYSSVDYEGVLTVTDPERFVAMLGQGIGKSLSLGCGLWLVRKL